MELKLGWVGWNQENGSDKIWGYLWANQPSSMDRSRVQIFWGRRGKTLSFKSHPYDGYLINLVDSKNRKGYMRINDAELRDIWPDFDAQCELKLVWHLMKDQG
jgi:hypothetical protein